MVKVDNITNVKHAFQIEFNIYFLVENAFYAIQKYKSITFRI